MLRVTWRALLGAVVGVLLPVPLLLLIGSVRHEGPRALAPEDPRVSPMLSFEERMNRVTYHSHCAKPADCEPPMGCLADPRITSHYCTDSECETDAQCPERSVCRVLTTMRGGPRVRFCIPVGLREEGERCLDPPPDRGYACGAGLLCGEGWCGRPCRKEEPTSCAQGFFCADIAPEPVCLPSCEERGCPEGQHCIDTGRDGVSVCAVVHGTNCQQSPCPEGQECRHAILSKHPGEAWMQCIQRCGRPGRPACPEGLVCHRYKCQQPCDPQASGTCGTGYRCARDKPDAPWLCAPDWEEE